MSHTIKQLEDDDNISIEDLSIFSDGFSLSAVLGSDEENIKLMRNKLAEYKPQWLSTFFELVDLEKRQNSYQYQGKRIAKK